MKGVFMFCYFGMIHHHAHPPLSMAARDEFRFSAILEFPTPRQQVQFFKDEKSSFVGGAWS
jgi:hypothetical protein